MSNGESNRLDRIEAIASRQEEYNNRIDFNAREEEALANERREVETKLDRAR